MTVQGWRPALCTCGHAEGDHQSAGTWWPHPPRFGVCLIEGCDCLKFEREPDRVAA